MLVVIFFFFALKDFDPSFFAAIKIDTECAILCQKEACFSFTVFNHTCRGYRRIFDYLESSYLESGARHFRKSEDCHENGYTQLSSGNSCYKIYEDQMNWTESERRCNSDGGFLAKLDNVDKLNSIQVKAILKNLTHLEYWTGLQEKEMIGQWKWVSDQDVLSASSSLWSVDEPNGGGSENCVGIERNGGLFDNPCGEKLAFICEK
ncbi:CD209 antigen-like protein 2 [Saccostrea cucullata]|uniref:CD209 antigen-like protein 2 n=1 Tax=Saccostrea cuccullata TaxID=36930 RepID=UPI002ED555E8